MSPITHLPLDLFLLGFVAACSITAALFFFRFWRATQDVLFLAFTLFFAVQGVSSAIVMSLPRPNEGNLGLFSLRLISVLSVLGAILWKNTSGLRGGGT